MSGVRYSAADRAAMIIEGECEMCERGEWPRNAISCPVCDADLPDDEDDGAAVRGDADG